MKKSKGTKETPLPVVRSGQQIKPEAVLAPLDVLTVKILCLRLSDDDQRLYAIKVTFLDQLLHSGIIKPVGPRAIVKEKTIAKGSMSYDPSDYEKMCLFADTPLIVNIQPLKTFQHNSNDGGQLYKPTGVNQESISSDRYAFYNKHVVDISCCNIDILPLFTDTDKICVKKRMEPMITPQVLQRKSWDNLPLLTMNISVTRNERNAAHHKVLNESNCMKFTLVGAYNMLIPYDSSFLYTAATKIPMQNSMQTANTTFNQGHEAGRRFDGTTFYPKWESLRIVEELFTSGDEKFVGNLHNFQNEANLDLKQHMIDPNGNFSLHTTIWGSFHRSLVLSNSEKWLRKRMLNWCWPLEVHVYGEQGGFSFMAFLNLFNLLYPGETELQLAVPLQWLNSEMMMTKCGWETLLLSTDKPTTQKQSKATTDTGPTSASTDTGYFRPTGANESCSFVVVAVKMTHPLVKLMIPRVIPHAEIRAMLEDMEEHAGPYKRECTGRGQLERDWQSTLRGAANSLRRVPHYGMTEFCTFNRQLSETRTRVEVMTSFWIDAAIYVNNNFHVHDYLESDQKFEELLLMTHPCLMKLATETLAGVDNLDIDPLLKAARNSRHLQDITHATDIYLLLASEKPDNGNYWRELATCLKDVDWDWAGVCIDRALVLDFRHPLTLLSKGCMVFDEDPDAAEPFFMALLGLYPFWATAWIVASTYFRERELFRMADEILECWRLTEGVGLAKEMDLPRAWERELGDWWESTPLLPGMSPYYDAADILLRIRAMSLAEACLAIALTEVGESAAYLHLVALCCRLRGNVPDALCHIQLAIEKFGAISYLKVLEGECLHEANDMAAAIASFEKASNFNSAFSILLSLGSREVQRQRSVLVDLLRRQPSAYAWMALADDWMIRAAVGDPAEAVTEEQTAAKTCAAACAVRALKFDRRASRAWALLSHLVKPSARRLYYMKMATACGYVWDVDKAETASESKQSLCHHLGIALRGCRCRLCTNLTL